MFILKSFGVINKKQKYDPNSKTKYYGNILIDMISSNRDAISLVLYILKYP
jgi:hypothetical protein